MTFTEAIRMVALIAIITVVGISAVGCNRQPGMYIDSLDKLTLAAYAGDTGALVYAPLISHAEVQPTKVHPGDTMTVTAEVSDSSGITSVTADMGGIETISLDLVEGSVYHGTYQGQWLVHDTTARDYVTTIIATNSLGKSSATDIVWSDPQTYERYHIESEGQQTTTLTTLQTALTMTFTPNVTGDFLILAYAVLGQSSVDYFTEWQVDYGVGPTLIDSGVIIPKSVTERATAGTHDVVNLIAAQSYSFRIKYRTSNASSTASIEKMSLAAISVSALTAGPDDNTKHAETVSASTTSSTYVAHTTLTFTPSTIGDYLVLASVGAASAVTNKSASNQLTIDTVSQGEVVREFPVANQYEVYALARKVNLTAAPHTLTLQYMTTGSTASVRNARITAIRLSDIGDFDYVESEAVATTTSATYVVKPGATITVDHATGNNHLVLYFALMNGSSAVQDYYGAGFLDGVLKRERIMRPNDASDYLPIYALEHNFVNSASHTNDIRFSALAGKTNSMKNARIAIFHPDTLAPFSDSGHTTYDNDFQVGQNTVYIQGCYYQTSTSFHVAYYDADDSRWLSDPVSSNANGGVNSSYTFTSNPTAKAGTWHAVIYADSIALPAETYTADDPNSIKGGAFTVSQDAITPPPDISNTPSSFPFGTVAESSTTGTGLTHFRVTNNSAFAVNITISGTDMTGGTAWTLSDTATPGTNIYGLNAGRATESYNIIVNKAGGNTLVSGLAGGGGTQDWGLQLLAPTSFSDGGLKSGTVTLTATQV